MALAVPVPGAIAGARLNVAFPSCCGEVAQVRFGLLRLCEGHGTEQVIAAFGTAVQPARVTRVWGLWRAASGKVPLPNGGVDFPNPSAQGCASGTGIARKGGG